MLLDWRWLCASTYLLRCEVNQNGRESGLERRTLDITS